MHDWQNREFSIKKGKQQWRATQACFRKIHWSFPATFRYARRMEKLSPSEREAQLLPLWAAGWEMVEGRDAMTKTFTFKTFRQAFAWMTEVALWAEKMDHHPEWSNVYNEVVVTLQTHTANGLTMLDTKLATRMESARKAT